MIRASGTVGFQGQTDTVSSSRLTNAVAASLAVAALSLCLIVALTVCRPRRLWRWACRSDPRFILDCLQRAAWSRANRHRGGTPMKSPVVIVAITLTAAILVAASLLIFVGTRKGPGTSTLNAPAPKQRMMLTHLV